MFKNYVKTAFRSLMKNKGFTAINILGLALGLCVCMLIVFYVIDEAGYDTYNTKAARIYRVNNDIKFGGKTSQYAVSPAPLAQTMLNDFPEVAGVVRFRGRGGNKVKKDGQNVQEDRMTYADSTTFNVFTLPMIQGDSKTALVEPRSVVINETIAKKYFNSTDVVGKTLMFNDTIPYKVTGVIKDIPRQSHFNFDFFLAMSGLDESKENAWLSNNFTTYLLLKDGADPQAIEAKFPAFVEKYVGGQLAPAVHMSYKDFEKDGNYFKLKLIALRDIHLRSNVQDEMGANGNIQFVYIFSAVAIFILLIACVNFMNLSTARSSNRAREVGVRKVLGSARSSLIAQFLSESVLVTFAATLIALAGAWLLLPVFNQMADKQLTFTLQTFVWLLPALLLVVVVIGCLAGSYPAFFLSAFQPVDVLKGKLSTGFKGSRLRSFLVVFQFGISIFLIIGTLVIYHQLNYIQSKDLGYNREQVLMVYNTDVLDKQARVFKEEIKRMPGVKNATLTGFTPTGGWRNNTTMFQSPTLDTKHAVSTGVWEIDEDYINTLGMKLKYGRNFSAEMKTDSSAVILNEAAVKILGYKNALDQELYMPTDNMAKHLKKLHVVGFIRDFNFSSLRENISPLAFLLNQNTGALSVSVKPASAATILAQIKEKWKTFSPNQQFNYSYMDDDFENAYRTEQRMGTISIALTSIAILIACLGLFGLAAYAAEQRTKEIGIRKVLGANVGIIVSMLSKDFIKLVFIAIVIASPFAWYLMHLWLKGFAYQDGIKWWVIALAGGSAVLIAFITISFQSIKAALANPVTSLKNE
ncbi:ABC transporter permease [Mucilaginibacter psychrotolerans]|uniref:FtsX-like permease family protein n=1 Tax=Mucilaginibacter psychrotolerans TaxID=1524096 RepID=A0A4Y8SKU3_9SPHI|nr:ABC transporter permease [Mucilaginibacter psychrotolerans]TFF39673.1 FtsX-like permease family protein [Mucilaginibacter psychrotolerans]